VLSQLGGRLSGLTLKGSTIQQVRFFSQEEACELVGSVFTGMISITGLDSAPAPLDDGWASVLRLQFDDIDRHWQNYHPITDEQSGEILSWLARYEDILRAVYVHCAQGQSRSAAVALFIANLYDLKMDERHARFYNQYVYDCLCRKYEEYFLG